MSDACQEVLRVFGTCPTNMLPKLKCLGFLVCDYSTPCAMQEIVGSILSIGAFGSLFGVVLYQNLLKDYPYRDLLFWTQLLYGASGMLDLMLVLRINVKIGIPDYFFIVFDEVISQLIGRIKWMPLIVLSSKLCPAGIEGTFFAMLMSIDHVGMLSSVCAGGVLLRLLKVSRTRFDNLWMAILIQNMLRIAPVGLLFLVPTTDPNANILPSEMLRSKKGEEKPENDETEMAPFVNNTWYQSRVVIFDETKFLAIFPTWIRFPSWA